MFKLIITITMLTAQPLDMKTFEFDDGYLYSNPALCNRMGESTTKHLKLGFLRLESSERKYNVSFRCDTVNRD